MPARQTKPIKQNNFAFIDSQNLNLGVKSLGWNLDFRKFRQYLREKYQVTTAYLFIGFMEQNQEMYDSLQKAGYALIFKPTFADENGEVKGNVDADLVLQAMIDYNHFDQAVIVSSDGDFYSLVKYFYDQGKLAKVISPYYKNCSALIKEFAREKLVFMNKLKRSLAYRKHNLKK